MDNPPIFACFFYYFYGISIVPILTAIKSLNQLPSGYLT